MGLARSATATTPSIEAGLSEADRITLPGPRRPDPAPPPAIGIPTVGGLVRPRVMAELDGLLGVRVCAVVAPAGSGKTTALAHWARAAPVDVAWWRAAPAAGDPASAVVAGLGEAVHHLAPQGARPGSPASLIDRVRRYPGPLVLVVDDLHLVAGAEVGRLLEALVLGTSAHLVLASRTPPTLNLARIELASMPVGPAELRFRVTETEQLFRSCYADPLDKPDARRLTRHTEGWAAALHLFHHSVSGAGRGARRRAVRDLAEAGFADEYVAHQVLHSLDQADLELLRATAPLEVLTGARCDRLRGATDSERRLRALARRGLVTVQGREYRLRSVVRAHLLATLRDEHGSDATGRIQRACAEMLAADGSPAAAARAYVAAGEWRPALDLLGRHHAEVLADPDLDWTAVVPPEMADERIDVARATMLLREGRLRAAAAALGQEPEDCGDLTVRHRTLARLARLWTTGDLQPTDAWHEQLRTTVRHPRQRREVAETDPDTAPVLEAADHAVAGNLTAARDALDAPVPADPVAALAARLLRAALHLDPHRAEELADEAELLGLPWFSWIATAIAAGGESLAAEADARGDRWGALLIAGVDAVRELRQGRIDVVAFDRLVARCRSLDAPALEAWARSGLALTAATAALPDAAIEAESAIGFAHSAQVPGAAAVAWAALGRARGRADLLARAADEADAVGMGCHPWEWVRSDHVVETPARATDRGLRVRCFGGFDIRVDERPEALNGVRPRARAVLRMLAVHAGRPVHRELLLEAMWPQLDAAAGTHNLHVCVSSLRTALEPGVPRGASTLLLRDGERYLLALPDDSESDLTSFDRETCAAEQARASGDTDAAVAALTRAMALYTGDVLPEDGPAEWVVGVRDRYRLRAAEAASCLAELHLGGGRPEEAAAAATRSLDIDACRDASWRQLISAHETTGDRAAAEQARRSYADVLVSLGVVESTVSEVRAGRRLR